MKTFKKLTLSTLVLAGFGILASGSYNTAIMKDNSFMSAATDIKFAKRLDEIQGKVVVGRNAASTTWQKIQPVAPQKEEVALAPKQTATETKKEENTVKVVEAEIAEPAIKGDLDLAVSKVFFKKELKDGTFGGSARTVDGVIEELYVSLPNGHQIEINTRERMQGNVFQYEDSETREMKSGLMYEVEPGKYMINLADHSQYPNARIELVAANGAQVAYGEDYYENTQGWGMDNQNHSGELAGEGEYRAQNEQYEYEDNAAQENTYGFDFKS